MVKEQNTKDGIKRNTSQMEMARGQLFPNRRSTGNPYQSEKVIICKYVTEDHMIDYSCTRMLSSLHKGIIIIIIIIFTIIIGLKAN